MLRPKGVSPAVGGFGDNQEVQGLGQIEDGGQDLALALIEGVMNDLSCYGGTRQTRMALLTTLE